MIRPSLIHGSAIQTPEIDGQTMDESWLNHGRIMDESWTNHG
ncbi:hypothetical protein [Halosquirtibacter xylanolyticus]